MTKLFFLILAVLTFNVESPSQGTPNGNTPVPFTDSTRYLVAAAVDACHCIDSIDLVEKDKNVKLKKFSGCIEQQIATYEIVYKLLEQMLGKGGNTISISDTGSVTHKLEYYAIERWLMDSCSTLSMVIKSNDEVGEKSFSDNKEAEAAYTKGVDLLQKENYAAALPFFKKAVEIDNQFAFAWDNLGICYRQGGDYPNAIKAYKASLKLEPKGKTALQNLPVVYMLQEKVDDAIAAYKDILVYYPDDPEVYYGIGIVYFQHTKNIEAALDNICKSYNIYISQKSPFRSDAEKVINLIYAQMKKDGKEEAFSWILKENNIESN